MAYYTLYTRDADGDAFAPQFGDHSEDAVKDEREDWLRNARDVHGLRVTRARNTRIVKTARVPWQAEAEETGERLT